MESVTMSEDAYDLLDIIAIILLFVLIPTLCGFLWMLFSDFGVSRGEIAYWKTVKTKRVEKIQEEARARRDKIYKDADELVEWVREL